MDYKQIIPDSPFPVPHLYTFWYDKLHLDEEYLWGCFYLSAFGNNLDAMSDHFNGKEFFNPSGAGRMGFKTFLKFMLAKRPEYSSISVTPSIPPPEIESQIIRATWVGHATLLIQTKGLNILTDPIWSERASPFSWIGPKRYGFPGIKFEDLPGIDAVLISHNHYDHMDKETLKRLNEKFSPEFFVPLGNGQILSSWGISNVAEMDWWDEQNFKGSKIVCLPAQHFSKRAFFGFNKALWAGWLFDFGYGKFYFAGDTGYFPGFREIGKEFGPITLAAFPIGAYEPREFIGPMHLNPEEVVKAHMEIKAEQSMGMHFDTFKLTVEPQNEPSVLLKKFLLGYKVREDKFLILNPGEWKEIDLTKTSK